MIAAASVYLIIVVAPTVAYDFPHPTNVTFNGQQVRLMGHACAPDVHDQHCGGRIGIAPLYGLQK